VEAGASVWWVHESAAEVKARSDKGRGCAGPVAVLGRTGGECWWEAGHDCSVGWAAAVRVVLGRLLRREQERPRAGLAKLFSG
jgi:hypothetical protein